MSKQTLENHFISQQEQHVGLSATLCSVIQVIADASKLIRDELLIAGLNTSGHVIGVTNSHGEEVKALDMVANDVLKDALSQHSHVCGIGSEEESDVVSVSCDKEEAYFVLFDPLDGSSNIDVNISVGTIFSIFKTNRFKDHMPSGDDQVAAGYVLYGSSTVLVLTTGHGVFIFTYHPNDRVFLLSQAEVKIPEIPRYYSINEALYPRLNPPLQDVLDRFKTSYKPALSSRYVGSLVADFHRNLLKGGLFLYPSTSMAPLGKLRLMYEANPLAFICEQAGGRASNGQQRILSVTTSDIHQRVPLIIGNSSMVEAVQVALSVSVS